jgi:hypothetical protein
MTSVQVSYWKDSRALFGHAAQVTTGNFLAHQDLGNILEKEDDLNGALELYRLAAVERPAYANIKIHENIASALTSTAHPHASLCRGVWTSGERSPRRLNASPARTFGALAETIFRSLARESRELTRKDPESL